MNQATCGGEPAGWSRRAFLGAIGAAAATRAWPQAGPDPSARPNLLWITCEDTSPWMGFGGDPQARTPNLDRLARESVHYTRAFATAPVCAPARFALISGLYAHAAGTCHLRSQYPAPRDARPFPARLRAAGYHCTNNVKTDYNCAEEPAWIGEAWTECSDQADWRSRPAGAPFFAVINLVETHQGPTNVEPPESFEQRIGSRLAPSERHDPAQMRVPPFYPDTTLIRAAMARVYDAITAMDRRVGEILGQLVRDGLADSTIVMFYSDHGQGIPRGKRTLYDTGLQVPLLVRIPPRWRAWWPGEPGARCDQLVSLVDFGATALSLCGIRPPEGTHGRAFLGPHAGATRSYIFGARDRVDEAYELSRAVRDGRWLYIRNFMPHLSWLAPEGYSDQAALRRELVRLAREGAMNEPRFAWAAPRKPLEELYDSEADPWQLRNLAGDPDHAATLSRLREMLRQHLLEMRDLGFMPEWRLAMLAADGTPPAAAAADDATWPCARVLETAEGVGRPEAAAMLLERTRDVDPSVRWWACVGLRSIGLRSDECREALRRLLRDCPPVRIEAAAALVDGWAMRDALEVLADAVRSEDEREAVHAARALQLLGPAAAPVADAMRAALQRAQGRGDWPMYLRFSLEPALLALDSNSGAK